MPVIKSTKSIIRKNSAGSEFIRRRINLIEGLNVTLTVADDSTNNEIDVTIAGVASGATTALDNLASVAINTSLISDTDATDDLGTSLIRWKDLYLSGNLSDATITTTVANILQKSVLTTKGDIYAATASSTPARLGVGTNDQVLTADSTQASGIKWAAAAGGANTALSNLASVAINLSLISDTNNTDNLGSSTIFWLNAYISSVYVNGTARLTGVGTTGAALYGTGNFYLGDGTNSVFLNQGLAAERSFYPDTDTNTRLGRDDRHWIEAYIDKIFLNNTVGADAFVSVKLSNTSGAQRVLGDVVIIDTTGGSSYTTTTTANSRLVVGVVVTTTDDIATGWVAVAGKIQDVKVDTGAVGVGDILVTSTTATRATVNNAPTAGTILGKALSSKAAGANGTVPALICLG